MSWAARSATTAHNINTPKENLFELRKSIGMVFQQPTPFRKSIRDNILFAPKRHGLVKTKAEAEELVESSLRAGGAVGRGERQARPERTCAFGRPAAAPLHRAHARDASGRRALRRAVFGRSTPSRRLRSKRPIRSIAETGICIIIVTHNMEQAARVSDRTAYFYMGDMVETGDTHQIFNEPRDQRLSDYLTGRFS